MNLHALKQLVSTERGRASIVIALWGLTIGSFLSFTLYQKPYLSPTDYALLFTVCIVAGAILNDYGTALGGYLAALAIGLTMFFALSIVPAPSLRPPGDAVVIQLWISIIFQTMIPIPAVSLFVATIFGAALGEKFLS